MLVSSAFPLGIPSVPGSAGAHVLVTFFPSSLLSLEALAYFSLSPGMGARKGERRECTK